MSNPVVLITGALTGIGRATAFAFAADSLPAGAFSHPEGLCRRCKVVRRIDRLFGVLSCALHGAFLVALQNITAFYYFPASPRLRPTKERADERWCEAAVLRLPFVEGRAASENCRAEERALAAFAEDLLPVVKDRMKAFLVSGGHVPENLWWR
jgi:NAD(P)-dependent dehydrogenase (short-subunit alcohol dehydrogenase family)